ncbi:hypothetical protein KNE206_18540 [Kitasatospora sp. NE20-6]
MPAFACCDVDPFPSIDSKQHVKWDVGRVDSRMRGRGITRFRYINVMLDAGDSDPNRPRSSKATQCHPGGTQVHDGRMAQGYTQGTPRALQAALRPIPALDSRTALP